MVTTEKAVLKAEFQWEIEGWMWERLTWLAQLRGEAIENVINDAIRQYITDETMKLPTQQPDSLVGLFEDDPYLASHAEDILEQELSGEAGLSWKE